jgi:hypothetical protein
VFDVFIFLVQAMCKTPYIRGGHIFQKLRIYCRFPGVRRVTRSKFHAEDSKILGVTVQRVRGSVFQEGDFIRFFLMWELILERVT